jgi:hypothetical protein
MMESSVDGKHEFGNKEIIQSNVVPEGFLLCSIVMRSCLRLLEQTASLLKNILHLAAKS